MIIQTEQWKGKLVRFLSAQTISLFGSSLVQYAIIWYITLRTSSGTMMTVATICGYLPQILISLFAGAWLDRYDRKKIMMLADGMIAGATLVIAVLFLAGHEQIWLLFGVLVVRSIGTGIQTPAVNALLPQLVPQEHLMKVNGINSSIQSLMMFLSPAVSGIMLTFTKIEVTFFIDVATAAVGIGMMLTIRIPAYKKEQERKTGSAIADLGQGLRYMNQNRQILRQIIFLTVIMILISPAAFLTPLLVSRTFGAEVWRLTLSEMTFSLGAVAGGVLIAAWGGLRSRIKTVLLATVFYGAMMVGIGASRLFVAYLIVNCLIGISMPCFNAPVNVLLQEEVEPAMHGRVFSMLQLANASALPLGTVIFGPIADRTTVQTILVICGAAVVLVAGLAWGSGFLTVKHKEKRIG